MPILDEGLDGVSCSNLFTMLLLLHPTKCPTPTQRSLGLTSMLTNVFGVEDLIRVVA